MTQPTGKLHLRLDVPRSRLRMVKRYRRRRTAKVLHFDAWNFAAEPGDLMVDMEGRLFRLEQSSGYRKRRSLGELTPRLIPPPQPGLGAKIVIGADGMREVWWVR